MARSKSLTWLVALLSAGAALLGCSERSAAPAAAAAVTSPPAGPHVVRVFATASLRRPFEALAKRYQQDHPEAKVELRCDGGAQLLAAMHEGAKCDVVAIGDSSLMSRFAAAAYLAPGSPTELARNRIAIVVAKANPKNIAGLRDLLRADVKLALGARSSSIGRHARWVLSHLGDAKPAVEANTADAVHELVASGQADAGIVYVTTLLAADARTARIDVPDEQNTPVLYSISVTRESAEPRGAGAFRALALGPVGAQIFADAGFVPRGNK